MSKVLYKLSNYLLIEHVT